MFELETAKLAAAIDAYDADHMVAGGMDIAVNFINRYGPQAVAWAQRVGPRVADWMRVNGSRTATVMSRFGDRIVATMRGGGGGTVDLYRAVGMREFQSVMTTRKFLSAANSMEGRQFALTLQEALDYAATDPSKVAILRATVQNSVIRAFDFSRSIDPHIFKSGVITVQPGAQSDLFHRALLGVEHAF